MRFQVLNKINNDLNIVRYDGESNSQFISRIIYSALSMWIRFATLDEDTFGETFHITGNVSKSHILNRCKPLLDHMVELFPECRFWFYPSGLSDDNPINVVRNRLYRSGELVDVGFKGNLGLPVYKECSLNSRVTIRRGLHKKPFSTMSGLSPLVMGSKRPREANVETIRRFFGLKENSATKFLKEYLMDIRWSQTTNMKAEFFNKYAKKSLSRSWEVDFLLQENDITLYKQGLKDFGFVKKQDINLYKSQISSVLIGLYEVRRFMYGLKNAVNNSVTARYRKLNNGMVELHLDNRLPLREESIFYLIGWPKRHINDLHFLFHKGVWSLPKLILKNLHIELEEL